MCAEKSMNNYVYLVAFSTTEGSDRSNVRLASSRVMPCVLTPFT